MNRDYQRSSRETMIEKMDYWGRLAGAGPDRHVRGYQSWRRRDWQRQTAGIRAVAPPSP